MPHIPKVEFNRDQNGVLASIEIFFVAADGAPSSYPMAVGSWNEAMREIDKFRRENGVG